MFTQHGHTYFETHLSFSLDGHVTHAHIICAHSHFRSQSRTHVLKHTPVPARILLMVARTTQVEMAEMQMMLEEQVKTENFFDAEKTKSAINAIMTRRAELAM